MGSGGKGVRKRLSVLCVWGTGGGGVAELCVKCAEFLLAGWLEAGGERLSLGVFARLRPCVQDLVVYA
jgi:hypothetical protein